MKVMMKKSFRLTEILLLTAALLCGCGAEQYVMKAAALCPALFPMSSGGPVLEEALNVSEVRNEAYSISEAQNEAHSIPEAEDRPQDAADIEWPQSWKEAYGLFLENWKLIEDYGDFSYLSMYFGEEHYSFDRYFLCDIDENGTPELLLYSMYMRLTAVFTYTDEPVFLLYNNLYGINLETDEVVINGHWHGAGGSGIDEWSACRITGDVSKYSMYIDYMDLREDGGEIRYTVYDEGTGIYEHPQDGAEYDAFYAGHVEPCIPMEYYRLYDLSDLNGLEDVQ